MDFLCTVLRPHFLDLARLLRRAYSRPFWITSFEFVKVGGIRFSMWESIIGFYICCYPLTTILQACLFSVAVRILWKKLCCMRAWRRRWHLVSPTLYIIIVYRVNLNKLLRNVVGANRTTTTNCRVSFIDLYLVFPTNFRIVFLPHTNTVILLELHCCTITEPGLPGVCLRLHGLIFLKQPLKRYVLSFFFPVFFSLRKHPLNSPHSSPLGMFRKTSPAAKSVEKRMFSQAAFPWVFEFFAHIWVWFESDLSVSICSFRPWLAFFTFLTKNGDYISVTGYNAFAVISL